MDTMNHLERYLRHEVPLHEASGFFLSLKTAAATDPPDETGQLEGSFTVPIANALSLLSELVKNEMETIYAYTVYGQTLRDLAHESISQHFNDHAANETEHVQFLLKRMSVLGGPAEVPALEPPHPSTDPVDIIQTMIRMEQEGIAGWHKLLAIVGDNPMRIKAEEYMAQEQDHLDDLWQMLRPVANPEAITATPKLPASDSAAPAAEKIPVKKEKPARAGGAVGKVAAACLAKQAEVFTEGTDHPSADPSDYKVNRMIARGNFDRRAARTPEAELAWNRQGQMTKGAATYLKMAAAFKLALDDMAGSNANVALQGGTGSNQNAMAAGQQADEPGSEQQSVAAPTPQAPLKRDPALSSFLGAERAGSIAELQQQAEYYKQLADQAQQSAQTTGEQLQQVQQQAGALQQQMMAAQQQIDQSMQQSQQVQQQAMQTAQSAQQIAAQSQQAHLQAVNESMMHQQLSEQMRAGVLQMKGNIQQALSQDPTQGIEMQLGAAGGGAGMPPIGANPTVGPEQQGVGPTANAPGTEVAPGGIQPEGGPPANQPIESSEPAMDGSVPTGEAKVSSVREELSRAFRAHAGKVKDEAKKRAPYALAGLATGAGLTALHRPHAERTKKDLDEAEAKGGGPISDLHTAKQKMRHAMAEYVDKHPVAGSAILGTAAASTASGVGPTVKNVVKGLVKHRGKI
jgi:bacterioferritin